MGFCRRCGNIVPSQNTRCKCGGSAVAPVVQWNRPDQRDGNNPDRWAETYVSNSADGEHASGGVSHLAEAGRVTPLSPARRQGFSVDVAMSSTRPARRFPRPLSTSVSTVSFADSGVARHITSTPAQSASPAKRGLVLSLEDSTKSTPHDVIACPDNATLAKAYGSVLQCPETLPIHTCASCSTVFPPDATIYPNPQIESGVVPTFLCRPCFAANGGSKGDCSGCGRHVLTATREGEFIESSGHVWHKRCFRCEGCHKEMGHAPMVDLLGQPSCPECFDTCLDRRGDPRTRKQLESSNNIGGLMGKSRESSPALLELSNKLGITRPAAAESNHGANRDSRVSLFKHMRESPPDEQSVCSGSLRLRDGTLSSTSAQKLAEPTGSIMPVSEPAGESIARNLSFTSSNSASSHSPPTPSDPPRKSFTSNSLENINPKTKEQPTQTGTATIEDSKCNRCSQFLFNTGGGGRIVTVPADNLAEDTISYHATCFRCCVCGHTFGQEMQDHATFVRSPRGVCHPECITENETSKTHPDHRIVPIDNGHSPSHGSECPPLKAPPLTRSLPRFGGSEACPGCREAVSLMEYGVVPGPQNTRWHRNCLVCGGKGSKQPRPGCGKKLDSSAKSDPEGRVWCRECTLLLPSATGPSPPSSPTRGRLAPSYTGNGFDRFSRPPEVGKLFGQVTGNIFLKSDALMVQLTGGGPSHVPRGSVSPTRRTARSVSPTKGLMPVTRHPRPMGSWKQRSVDEGRGMFLVKQMTGNGL